MVARPRAPMESDTPGGGDDLPLFDLNEANRSAGVAKRVWMKRVIAFVREYVEINTYITPAELRAWAKRTHNEPEHANHWGGVWAKLRTMGLEPTGDYDTSRTRSRNAAKEQRWMPTEKWRAA